MGKWILLNGYQIEIMFMFICICLSKTKKLNIVYAGIDR
jgi:hypothetical protein